MDPYEMTDYYSNQIFVDKGDDERYVSESQLPKNMKKKKPHKRRVGDIDLPQEVLVCDNLRQLVPFSVANIYLPIIDALITLFYHAPCLLLFNISSKFAAGAKTVICLTK